MNIPAAVAAINPMRVVHRFAIPLLAVEPVGLLGLVTSWHIASVVALVLTAAAIVSRALRHASGQIDAILREELTPDQAESTEGLPDLTHPSSASACSPPAVR